MDNKSNIQKVQIATISVISKLEIIFVQQKLMKIVFFTFIIPYNFYGEYRKLQNEFSELFKKTFVFQKHQIKVKAFVALNSDEYFVEYEKITFS
jgi:hypothetical protein